MRTRSRKAFTLVEMIVVIVVIGILAILAILAFNWYINKAEESAVKQAATQVGKLISAQSTELQVAPDAFTQQDLDPIVADAQQVTVKTVLFRSRGWDNAYAIKGTVGGPADPEVGPGAVCVSGESGFTMQAGLPSRIGQSLAWTPAPSAVCDGAPGSGTNGDGDSGDSGSSTGWVLDYGDGAVTTDEDGIPLSSPAALITTSTPGVFNPTVTFDGQTVDNPGVYSYWPSAYTTGANSFVSLSYQYFVRMPVSVLTRETPVTVNEQAQVRIIDPYLEYRSGAGSCFTGYTEWLGDRTVCAWDRGHTVPGRAQNYYMIPELTGADETLASSVVAVDDYWGFQGCSRFGSTIKCWRATLAWDADIESDTQTDLAVIPVTEMWDALTGVTANNELTAIAGGQLYVMNSNDQSGEQFMYEPLGVSNVTRLSSTTSWNSFCGITAAGTISCGEIGPFPTNENVGGFTNVKDFAFGDYMVCAIRTNGSVVCQAHGDDGNFTTVPEWQGATQVFAMFRDTLDPGVPRAVCALKDGSISCANDDATNLEVTPIDSITGNITSVNAWPGDACFTSSSGSLQCVNYDGTYISEGAEANDPDGWGRLWGTLPPFTYFLELGIGSAEEKGDSRYYYGTPLTIKVEYKQ